METERYSQPFSPNGSGNHQPQSLPVVYPALPYESDEDELNLSQLFAAMRRRALLIAGVAIAVTSAALLLGLTRTPQYGGKFELLVEPVTQSGQSGNLPSIAEQASDLLGGEELEGAGLDYDTQIAVLQSPKIMSAVIERLQARYPDVTYSSLIGTSSDKLSIVRREETKIIDVSYQNPDPQRVQFVLDQVALAYMQYSVQDRRTNLRQGLRFVEGQIPRFKLRVSVLEDQLQRFQQQYNLTDPAIQAQQIAAQTTALRQQRVENQAELKQTQSLYTTLQKQLGLEPNKAIGASALSEDTQYQALLTELQKVESQIAIEKARFNDVSPTIQNLRDQQQNLLLASKRESQRVLGRNLSRTIPNPQALASQNSVRLELTQQLAEAANQVQALGAKDRAITQAQNILNRELKQFPALARQYIDLQRDLEATVVALNQLLAKRETLRVDSAQQDVPWELIAEPLVLQDAAGNPVPVSPKIPLYVGLGVILGLLLGGIAALILESLSSILHTSEAIKETTGLPMLGEVPLDPQVKSLSLISLDQQKSSLTANSGITFEQPDDAAFLEAFRSISTNVRNLSLHSSNQALVISSATPGEGKSTIAVYLAYAAAEMGRRVLLVDANLQHPQIHTSLGLPNYYGLANLIATKSGKQAAIQRSPAGSNLSILTAGEVLSNPAMLLASKEMQNLMEQFQAEFDLVIYDTPSVLSFTDSSLLMPYVDGAILVVAVNQTDRSQLTHTLDRLNAAQAQVLGFVANGVTSSPNVYHSNGQSQPKMIRALTKTLSQKSGRLP